MARRRTGMRASLAQMQREAERARAAQQRDQARSVREQQRTLLAHQRATVADERERKLLYAEARAEDVAADNEALDHRVQQLESVLSAALGVVPRVDLDALAVAPRLPVFDPSVVPAALPPPDLGAFLPAGPSGMGRMFGGAGRQQEQMRQGREAFERADQEHRQWSAWREDQLAAARQQHEAEVARLRTSYREQKAQVDELKRGLTAGEPAAVVAYLDLVLGSSPFPDGFPNDRRLAYVPESKQLVIEYELPTLDVVPLVKSYRYVKASDTITETARPQAQVRALYASVVVQTALRIVRNALLADRAGHVETVVLNAMVTTSDPATGQTVHPCLLTVRTTRSTFMELDLSRVEPSACLRHLGAGVSRSPAELTPVRPVLEFDMVDPRFVTEEDVLGGLDTRPNLLEMTPTEFEGLIQNLFTRMGLESRQTRASRDGGVDCVAYDPRPIMGGKVVIQAKRYRHTVGVSAVRDLYGTLQNEGASKGILVTTSGYGQASHDFAKNKPIELLDGANLLYTAAGARRHQRPHRDAAGVDRPRPGQPRQRRAGAADAARANSDRLASAGI